VNWRTIARATVLAVATALLPTAGLAASPGPPVGHFHAMPCTHTAPDELLASWRIQFLDSHQSGRATIRRPNIADSLYRDICSYRLVSYDRPFVCACPAAFGDGIYHFAFYRGRHALLHVTEHAIGLITLSVDGRPDLGNDILGCLILPPGVPATPYARAVRPGHWNCLA
jgi:hypothetical protein